MRICIHEVPSLFVGRIAAASARAGGILKHWIPEDMANSRRNTTPIPNQFSEFVTTFQRMAFALSQCSKWIAKPCIPACGIDPHFILSSTETWAEC